MVLAWLFTSPLVRYPLPGFFGPEHPAPAACSRQRSSGRVRAPADQSPALQRPGPIKIRHVHPILIFAGNYYAYEHKDLRIGILLKKVRTSPAVRASPGCHGGTGTYGTAPFARVPCRVGSAILNRQHR